MARPNRELSDLPVVVADQIETMADEVATLLTALTEKEQLKAWAMLFITTKAKKKDIEEDADDAGNY